VDNKEFHTWYYLPYETFSGAFNMALDYFLAEHYKDVLQKPLLRFYGWNPYCLSIGIHQKPEDVDLKQCEKLNVDVVRRPTGGRAVLHSEELTYSVIVPPEYLNLHQLYEYIHVIFSNALRKIGVPAQLEENQPDLREFYKKKHSNLCFASAAKTEVKVNNKKLIGSAQHLFRDAILQHGSILIGSYHKNIVRLFHLNETEKKSFEKIISKSTTEIRQFRKDATAETVAKQIEQEFRLHGIEFDSFDLSGEVIREVKKLESKFAVHYKIPES
jgi:lipoate-protein ligase A